MGEMNNDSFRYTKDVIVFDKDGLQLLARHCEFPRRNIKSLHYFIKVNDGNDFYLFADWQEFDKILESFDAMQMNFFVDFDRGGAGLQVVQFFQPEDGGDFYHLENHIRKDDVFRECSVPVKLFDEMMQAGDDYTTEVSSEITSLEITGGH